MASLMKKLFLSEFDTPVHLTINGAGSDKKADYNDNTDTWGYIFKNASHSIRDLRQQILIKKTSRDFRFCRMSKPTTDNQAGRMK